MCWMVDESGLENSSSDPFRPPQLALCIMSYINEVCHVENQALRPMQMCHTEEKVF